MDKFAEVNPSSLSKKERRELKREMEREEREKKGKTKTIVKLLSIVILLGVVGGGVWWVVKELSKPLPGQQLSDQGREHVKRQEWEKFAYNSNPPTSGPHDEVWTKAGVYDREQGDGHLVHALEHGYVVLSYNCNLESEKFKVQSEKLGTESAEASKSGNLPPPLSPADCDGLEKQLSDLANDKKLSKLIVVPRQNLDTRIALTAWTHIDKLDTFDKARISLFIDAYRNHGPEQTME